MPYFHKTKGYYLDSSGDILCDKESLSKFISFFDSAFHNNAAMGHTVVEISRLISKGDLDRYEKGTNEHDIEINRKGIAVSHSDTGEKLINCTPDEFAEALIHWEAFLDERHRRKLKQELKENAPDLGLIWGAIIGFSLAFAGAVVLFLFVFGSTFGKSTP